MTTASDDFNRADGAPGANWLTWLDAATAIASNTMKGSASGTTCGVLWNGATNDFTDDQECSFTIGTLDGGEDNDNGPAVRCSGSGGSADGYALSNYDNTNIYLYKIVDGAFDEKTHAAGVYGVGKTIKIRASGNVISAYLDGVEIFSYTDVTSPLTGGQPGLYAYRNGIGFDNFLGADVVSGQNVSPTGQASAAAYGTQTAAKATPKSVQPAGKASAAAYGAHTIADVQLSASPVGIGSAAVLGALIVGHPGQATSLTGISSATGYGNQTLSKVSAKIIAPSGLTSPAVFGTHGVSSSPVSSSGVPTAAVYGSQTLASTGVQLIQLVGKSSAVAFGSQVISKVSSGVVAPAGKPTAAVYGTQTIADVQLKVTIPGLAAPYRYGAHRFIGGVVPVVPEGGCWGAIWRAQWQA